MKNERIEQELRGWFTQMLEKHTWLSIKFEYNSRRGCFMVSFSPESIINQDEEFCKEALAFEEKLDEEYNSGVKTIALLLKSRRTYQTYRTC